MNRKYFFNKIFHTFAAIIHHLFNVNSTKISSVNERVSNSPSENGGSARRAGTVMLLRPTTAIGSIDTQPAQASASFSSNRLI